MLIFDCLWALQAFFRGKVLRQKAYRPEGNLFKVPAPTSVRRMRMFIRLWGYQPATVAQAIKAWQSGELKPNDMPYVALGACVPDAENCVPTLNWASDRAWLTLDWRNSDNFRYLAVRK